MKLSSSRILAADVLSMFDAAQNGECRVQYPEMMGYFVVRVLQTSVLVSGVEAIRHLRQFV